MYLIRKADQKRFRVLAPKSLPTKEEMQALDVTASFVELEDPDAPEAEPTLVIYAPFSEHCEWEVEEVVEITNYSKEVT